MRPIYTNIVIPLCLLFLTVASFFQFYAVPKLHLHSSQTYRETQQTLLYDLSEQLKVHLSVENSDKLNQQLRFISLIHSDWLSLSLYHQGELFLSYSEVSELSAAKPIWLSSSVSGIDQTVWEFRIQLDLANRQLINNQQLFSSLAISLFGVLLLASVLIAAIQYKFFINPLGQLLKRQRPQTDSLQPILFQDSVKQLEQYLNEQQQVAKQEQMISSERYSQIERRFLQAQKAAQLGCWEWNPHTERFWCSENLRTIMHFDEGEEATWGAFFTHAHPADSYELQQTFRQATESQQPFEAEFRVNIPNGTQHTLMVGQIHQSQDSNEAPSVYFGICQNINERKSIESSLRKLSSAITFSGSAVMIINILGPIEYVNPKYTESTGFELAELLEQVPDILSRRWMDNDTYELLWKQIMDGQTWRGELQGMRKNGDLYWSLASISPIKNEFGELTHFVVVLEDVTELKDAHARMEQLALYDELTGLPNRRLFFQKLEAVLEKQHTDHLSAVILLDLDYFKNINDTMGHHAGDELLRAVAVRLQYSLHETDVAARLGGDEFAILIREVHSADDIQVVADRILSTLSSPLMLAGAEIQTTTSMGISIIPQDGYEAENILKHADLAMYQAKELGRNQYRFFTEHLHEQLQTYIRFSKEMPDALKNGEFMLYYQPQIDLKTGLIIGAEALIRWQHPELGIVPPPKFITVAEETGFILQMGHWIIKEACHGLNTLSQLGYPEIRISINLSARQFRDPQLLVMLQQIIHESGVDPARLEVEITETLLMHDVEQAIETLKEVKKMGITIAIDDFGIGYSSFSYLKMLPIDILKVDREFIKDIPDHLDDMEITAAIISMAHRLRMQVVAEGIETTIQQVFLQEHHCDIGQGYLFSRPIPMHEFSEHLKTVQPR